jgi:hypothetical protein
MSRWLLTRREPHPRAASKNGWRCSRRREKRGSSSGRSSPYRRHLRNTSVERRWSCRTRSRRVLTAIRYPASCARHANSVSSHVWSVSYNPRSAAHTSPYREAAPAERWQEPQRHGQTPLALDSRAARGRPGRQCSQQLPRHGPARASVGSRARSTTSSESQTTIRELIAASIPPLRARATLCTPATLTTRRWGWLLQLRHGGPYRRPIRCRRRRDWSRSPSVGMTTETEGRVTL